jgi:hypothetical protein
VIKIKDKILLMLQVSHLKWVNVHGCHTLVETYTIELYAINKGGKSCKRREDMDKWAWKLVYFLLISTGPIKLTTWNAVILLVNDHYTWCMIYMRICLSKRDKCARCVALIFHKVEKDMRPTEMNEIMVDVDVCLFIASQPNS